MAFFSTAWSLVRFEAPFSFFFLTYLFLFCCYCFRYCYCYCYYYYCRDLAPRPEADENPSLLQDEDRGTAHMTFSYRDGGSDERIRPVYFQLNIQCVDGAPWTLQDGASGVIPSYPVLISLFPIYAF